jgi:diguanylate cyclase (GGDEF)-like protein
MVVKFGLSRSWVKEQLFILLLRLKVTKAKRQQEPISLIVCDIDFFKVYDDNYGHT